jgi:hypothetical protein
MTYSSTTTLGMMPLHLEAGLMCTVLEQHADDWLHIPVAMLSCLHSYCAPSGPVVQTLCYFATAQGRPSHMVDTDRSSIAVYRCMCVYVDASRCRAVQFVPSRSLDAVTVLPAAVALSKPASICSVAWQAKWLPDLAVAKVFRCTIVAVQKA